MQVLLLPNRMKDTDLTVTRQIVTLLCGMGAGPILPDEFSADLPGSGARFMPYPEAFRQADQIITVGGDGTLLRASADCLKYGKPVLGINLGRVGFLATCEVSELPRKLSLLVEGNFAIEPRRLLRAEVTAHGWIQTAMNDIVLFGNSRLHPMDYTIYCDGAFVARYRSDGVIAATPTGSTAYSLSAGGPVLDAKAPVMVLTPVCAHSVRAVPLVFSSDRRLTVVAEKDNRETVYVSADSNARCDLQPGEAVNISTAPDQLGLITFGGTEQFHAIETKLMRR